jgi:hypothetical protein
MVGAAFSGSFIVNAKFFSHSGSKPNAEFLGLIPNSNYKQRSDFSLGMFMVFVVVLMVSVMVGAAFSGSFMVKTKFSSHLGSKPLAEFLGLIPISNFIHGSVFSMGMFMVSVVVLMVFDVVGSLWQSTA